MHKTLARLIVPVLPVVLAASSLSAQRTATQPARRPALGGYQPEFGTMWTFDAPPLTYWKAKYNFAPDQAWLDHVRLASVRLPGCSSSFVSAQGLVMTNHHCGRSCTAAVSPKDTNYIATGFAATSMADEKKCPGLYVDQLQSIEDVTARVQQAITATTPAKQVEQRNAAIEKIQTECHDQTSLTCQVVTFYQGGMYSLYRYKRYDDVRLVMAPEEGIAFFGGDPDNFTFPRYDLDLTLLRVYESGAPLATNDFLRFSANGPSDGELVFVTGNPGSTGRLLTVAQMEFLRDVQYPAALAQYDRLLAAYRERSKDSPEAARAYENAIFGIANSRKAVTGYRAGLLDSAIMARKRVFERDFRSRIATSPALSAKYGKTWNAIADAERELRSFDAQRRFSSFSVGSSLLQLAGEIVDLPAQAALPDSLRMTGWRGPRLERMKDAVLRAGPADTAYEKLILAAHLDAARKALKADDPLLRILLGGRSPEVAAEYYVHGTALNDPAARKALLDGGTAAVASSKDPLIVLARVMAPIERRDVRRAERLNDVISANAELIGQAIFAAYGKSLPPDATFTLRITDGVVKGYPQNGTVAPWKTTMYGLFGRSAAFDNKPPFNLPQRWLDARDRLALSTPMDFVSTNDIIGGNSGSPVINRDAEIVGLIFDENIECLPNRFIFTDEAARSVSVDSRAIVEALRKVYQVGWIADELLGAGTKSTGGE